MSLRIKGLIGFLKHTREQLRHGLTPDEVDAFKQRVRGTVREVEAICRAHGTTPKALPTPSHNAYRFLKTLDLDDLPIRQQDQPATPKIYLKNVVSIRKALADYLWHHRDALHTSSAEAEAFCRNVRRHIGHVEQICRRQDATPSALAGHARSLYAWLRLLDDAENVQAYAQALGHVRRALTQHVDPARTNARVHLVPMKSLWSIRQDGRTALLQVSVGFLYAGPKTWDALVRSSFAGKTRADRRAVEAFTYSETYHAVLFELEACFEHPETSTRGHVHNLDESFERVNRGYFQGKMEKPTLYWNQIITTRKFGHYRFAHDTLMVSIALDDPRVPAYVVDFVMYHELLHKKHGLIVKGGRQIAHTPAFRTDERVFARYREAEAHLKRLAGGQGGL